MSYGQKSDFQDNGRFNICCIVYQISSKSDDFSLRYGDLTIFKMAASATVIFKKQFFSRGLCRHVVLLPHTKFRWNRTLGRWVMAKKSDFQDGDPRYLKFLKIQFLVTWLPSGSIFAVVYQISSKLDDFYRDIDIANLSVCLSVRNVPVLDENGLTYRCSFSTVRKPNHSSFTSVIHFTKFRLGHPLRGR